jgi:transcriptional regulator with XRE-family HTH domain
MITTTPVVAKTMLIAERIKGQMEACELTQAALAREVGVSQQSIGRLVSGEAIGSRYLHKIAAALHTTPAYLTGETDDPTSELPDDPYSSDERDLINQLRQLPPAAQAAVRDLVKSLTESCVLPSTTVHTPSRTYRGQS